MFLTISAFAGAYILAEKFVIGRNAADNRLKLKNKLIDKFENWDAPSYTYRTIINGDGKYGVQVKLSGDWITYNAANDNWSRTTSELPKFCTYETLEDAEAFILKDKANDLRIYRSKRTRVVKKY